MVLEMEIKLTDELAPAILPKIYSASGIVSKD